MLWLILAIAAGAVWFYSGSLQMLWLRITRQQPKPSTTYKSPPEIFRKTEQAKVTGDKLDEGLGIGLQVYSDYHTLLDKTKDHGIEWKFTAEGSTLRLSAPGVIVYVDGKDITAYTLRLDQIFAEEHWGWWQAELTKAGVSDQTTSAQVGGEATKEARVSLYGSRSIHRRDGWATPAFELDFFQDKLSELHAGIRPGPGPDQPAGR